MATAGPHTACLTQPPRKSSVHSHGKSHRGLKGVSTSPATAHSLWTCIHRLKHSLDTRHINGDTYNTHMETLYKDMEIKTQRHRHGDISRYAHRDIYPSTGTETHPRHAHRHTQIHRETHTHTQTLMHTHGDIPRSTQMHRHVYAHIDTETICLVFPCMGSTDPSCHLPLRKTSHFHTCCAPQQMQRYRMAQVGGQ